MFFPVTIRNSNFFTEIKRNYFRLEYFALLGKNKKFFGNIQELFLGNFRFSKFWVGLDEWARLGHLKLIIHEKKNFRELKHRLKGISSEWFTCNCKILGEELLKIYIS